MLSVETLRRLAEALGLAISVEQAAVIAGSSDLAAYSEIVERLEDRVRPIVLGALSYWGENTLHVENPRQWASETAYWCSQGIAVALIFDTCSCIVGCQPLGFRREEAEERCRRRHRILP